MRFRRTYTDGVNTNLPDTGFRRQTKQALFLINRIDRDQCSYLLGTFLPASPPTKNKQSYSMIQRINPLKMPCVFRWPAYCYPLSPQSNQSFPFESEPFPISLRSQSFTQLPMIHLPDHQWSPLTNGRNTTTSVPS